VLGEDIARKCVKTIVFTGSEVWMASNGNRFETEEIREELK